MFSHRWLLSSLSIHFSRDQTEESESSTYFVACQQCGFPLLATKIMPKIATLIKFSKHCQHMIAKFWRARSRLYRSREILILQHAPADCCNSSQRIVLGPSTLLSSGTCKWSASFCSCSVVRTTRVASAAVRACICTLSAICFCRISTLCFRACKGLTSATE